MTTSPSSAVNNASAAAAAAAAAATATTTTTTTTSLSSSSSSSLLSASSSLSSSLSSITSSLSPSAAVTAAATTTTATTPTAAAATATAITTTTTTSRTRTTSTSCNANANNIAARAAAAVTTTTTTTTPAAAAICGTYSPTLQAAQLAAAAAAAAAAASSSAGGPGMTTATTTATPRAMQSDEDFNIRFVNLVRTHKCLYDKKVPEYRNRDNQEKAWSLISLETRESVIHCKERWRNLRACLSRYIKQQNSADPQHKPYYLTEHMAFLLPFLKSTRNSLENGHGHGHGITTLFQITQQHLNHHHHHHQTISPNSTIQVLGRAALPPHFPYSAEHMEMKHSLSDHEDEETIDAFDPAITASLQMHQAAAAASAAAAAVAANQNGIGGGQHNNHNHNHNGIAGVHHNTHNGIAGVHHNTHNGIAGVHHHHNGIAGVHHNHNHDHNHSHDQTGGNSPALSDTASANTMQNFIPDVQLSELRTPEAVGTLHDLSYAAQGHINELRRDSCGGHDSTSTKRIKTECNSSDSQTPGPMHMYAVENSDMEFFRSILPDIAALTPQQKRKFKIGILELIDDVVDRYPVERLNGTANGRPLGAQAPAMTMTTTALNGGSGAKQRRTSARDWRK